MKLTSVTLRPGNSPQVLTSDSHDLLELLPSGVVMARPKGHLRTVDLYQDWSSARGEYEPQPSERQGKPR